ncbi:hypothetical protein [Caproiciproducens galactitolivorans]|uniref:Uncharacterized protein n=1 Tax=Caproiciproducens galactitolivorans TaxID=642589 RepID=A0A4Z0XZA8_9FIRM|nr:hypothetical protein [Caproiciproducens galactitolivorans]TGJ76794.1 hypothetical protein CAGA_13410 [Caproiciproducens galactitolivorans]
MDNNRSNEEYSKTPCAGCQGAGMPTGLSIQSTMPTLEDVASYNYMNPLQKQQFSQQLKEMGSSHPSIPGTSRNSGVQPPLLAAGIGGAAMGITAEPAAPGQFPGMMTQSVPGSGTVPTGSTQTGQMQRMPASPAAQAALLPAATGSVMSPGLNQAPPQSVTINADSLQYLNGFLRTQIGRPVLVEFLIGTNTLVDRSGTLLGVGVNYILLQEAETDDLLACDFYNIKFIKFYY